MTRGWDPNGSAAKDDIKTAVATYQDPPINHKENLRVEYGDSGPPPNVLWIVTPQGVEP